MTNVCLIVEAAGGKALPCIVDVRDEKQINEAVEQAVEKFGGELQYFIYLKFWALLCFNLSFISCGSVDRDWHIGQQCQCHQFNRNSGNSNEESRPYARRQSQGNVPDVSKSYSLEKGSWRDWCPAEFSSNPNQTHLKQLINVYTWNFQGGVLRQVWAKLCRTQPRLVTPALE